MSFTRILIVLCFMLLAGAAAPSAQTPSKGLFLEKPVLAAPFSVRTLDGQTISSRDLRGKVAIINFWATWCAPCRAEIPDLIKLQAKYQNQLVVVGIAEDEGGADQVATFVAEHRMNYPVALSSPELHDVFTDILGIPTTFILDREGRIVQRHSGILDPKVTERQVRVLAGLESLQ